MKGKVVLILEMRVSSILKASHERSKTLIDQQKGK